MREIYLVGLNRRKNYYGTMYSISQAFQYCQLVSVAAGARASGGGWQAEDGGAAGRDLRAAYSEPASHRPVVELKPP